MNIAIVDDDAEFIETIKKYLADLGRENGKDYKATGFSNAVDFLSDYDFSYDIVLMDIEMPMMNGISAAAKLRELDANVCLMFITSIAQYAIDGYSVNALDYILKPLSYYYFCDKIKRAEKYVYKHEAFRIPVKTATAIQLIDANNILYIEKYKNYIVYHTEKEDLSERGTIKDAESKLKLDRFTKISYGCIVNLAKITSTNKSSVQLGEIILPISHNFYKLFTEAFIAYLSNE